MMSKFVQVFRSGKDNRDLVSINHNIYQQGLEYEEAVADNNTKNQESLYVSQVGAVSLS
jgi:hypothetical protein